MRALAQIQKEHPRCHTVVVGGDEISYGRRPAEASSWREAMLRQVQIDPNRTHFVGKLPYDLYRKALQVSAAHVYLTYPFVLSWSALEAMATGCLIVGSDTAPVREVVSHGQNGLLVPFFDEGALTTEVCSALAKPHAFARHRKRAAQDASRYSLGKGTDAYCEAVLGRKARS
jgi:glycosyltransferase involved in cell wall biosynthesis